MAPATTIRDLRSGGFCWVGCRELAAIKRTFTGKERTTALGIYLALTELANEARAQSFQASRTAIAGEAGVSPRTLDRYAEVFVELGLLAVERHVDERGQGPNIWSLLDVPEVSAANSTPPSSEAASNCEAHAGASDGGEEEEPPRPPEPNPVDAVWATYVEVMKPRRTVAGEEERRLIRDALKVATVVECRGAIRGCRASAFHMGENDRRKPYNRLSHILKGKRGTRTTREQIDLFLDIADRTGGLAGPSASAAKVSKAKDEVLAALAHPSDERVVKRGASAREWLMEHGWRIETVDGRTRFQREGA